LDITKDKSSSQNICARRVISGHDDARQAAEEVARLARKSLVIFTHDLEPSIYDQNSFIEIVKRLVLSRAYARIRVLVARPQRAVKDGHRLVTLGRRLNSYVEFRNIHKDYMDRTEAYIIADDFAISYRLDANRWDGIADTCSPAVAKRYLGDFDAIWAASLQEPELRVVHL
jgi:hypothetical protein